jgi:hypothetical protein
MADKPTKAEGAEQPGAEPKKQPEPTKQLEQRKTDTLEFRLVESQLMPSSKKDNVQTVHYGEVGDFVFKISATLQDGKVTINWPWKDTKPTVKFRPNQRKEQRLEPLQTAIERELGTLIEDKVKELNGLLDA